MKISWHSKHKKFLECLALRQLHNDDEYFVYGIKHYCTENRLGVEASKREDDIFVFGMVDIITISSVWHSSRLP